MLFVEGSSSYPGGAGPPRISPVYVVHSGRPVLLPKAALPWGLKYTFDVPASLRPFFRHYYEHIFNDHGNAMQGPNV